MIPKVPVAARLLKQSPCLANSRATRSLHLNPPQATFSAMAKKGKKAAPAEAPKKKGKKKAAAKK